MRAGIIGGGFMALVHARALRALGVEVAGVASSSQASAVMAAERIGATRAFPTVGELIASSDVEVVHVCSPNSTHATFAAQAVAAGKAVVCEKPLATTVEDALRLARAASEAGVPTAVPFVYRFYPVVREIRARVMRGDIGRPLLLHGSYLQDWLADPAETDWRVSSTLGGASRAFADIGVHWCDVVEFVTGQRITRLNAKMTTAFGSRGNEPESVETEDIVTMMFETDGQASGSLMVSQVSSGRKNRLAFSIDGEAGALAFNQEEPNTLWAGSTTENRIIHTGSSAMSLGDVQRLTLLPPGHPQGYQDAFNAFLADAYGRFEGLPVRDVPTFEDGLRAALLTDAVTRSSQLESWVDVSSLTRVAAPVSSVQAPVS
ncbi:Gfo/Idh/MocA family protein [Microcella alkaliphila]|uniref:Oxidoreductase domain protein n=1 Tax=Microcella alkaliphila TaxID=279828 RepID=A0A0U5BJT9_9MICO|nr:Gfo/Idh/MocA family oxidoreductase [Microcella alkaliphila]BAU33390.1 oxidoreductase domain protein [Microcella alkaliphila]